VAEDSVIAQSELMGGACVVTGGAGGIGLAMGRRFAAAGLRVVLADIEQGALDSAVDGFPTSQDRVLGVRCDVTSVEDMRRLRDVATERFGSVEVVCLNAGVAPTGSILDTPIEVWDWVYDVNVRGVVHGIQTFVPAMVEQGSGHVVCTASAAGLVDTPSMGAYGMTKHAVVGIAGALRNELLHTGVGVSVVCPGLVATRIFESERNQPEGVGGVVDEPASQAFRSLVAEHGVPPDVVAEHVLRAVLDQQFFVLPTSDTDAGIEARIAAIRQGLAWRDEVEPPAAGR
jgi:NAD(P)-dependent dehydrogenase (short-subunit alcohol dehydrogenase family)